ncbi:HEAT repeat domain-containing protein [Chondromyces crocatus]|uniref:Uncharacterized protein n=1 Tax=Chondromyces crocatus TaxID=52 RepID=A0A0K1E700_CHOCO|nr:hypothetical protein [Chondromyces crocatus]AKT36646.1 uncharacterized protein CMC5_007660 [Chondromyces crocatus]
MKQTLACAALLTISVLTKSGWGNDAGNGGVVAPSRSTPALPALRFDPPPEADPNELGELDRILDQLTSPNAQARQSSLPSLESSSLGMIGAVRARVQDIRGSLDRKDAARILGDARSLARKRHQGSSSSRQKKGSEPAADEVTGEWLDFVLADPHPDVASWRDLVKLLGMNRILATIGTTPATRELIAMYAYFGDLLRLDLQRHIGRLRDKAVPGLLEARQHDAVSVQRWARRQLDELGRAIPSEAVSTDDVQVLTDIMRAYGRTRDVDAVRVILSFCNSERERLREAARQAIAAIGEPALWQLRDAYLNMNGTKPPREWSWDQIARELFAAHDRSRLLEVNALIDQGTTSASGRHFSEATKAFDTVLTRAPLLDGRDRMSDAYAEHARTLENDRARLNEALRLMRKSLRLSAHLPPSSDARKASESDAAYLEGLLLLQEGTPDSFPFKRALELNPAHALAKQTLESLSDSPVEPQLQQKRYTYAAVIGLMAILAMTYVAWPRRTKLTPRDASANGAIKKEEAID